jgi:uncharacterized phage infection (PIP) family protein YhgE
MKSVGEVLIEIHTRHDRHDVVLQELVAGFRSIKDTLEKLMNANLTLTGEIGALHTSVNNTRGAVNSAIVLLNGIQARVEAAVAKALANGATQSQLAEMQQLATDLDAGTSQLAAAVAAVPPQDTGNTTTGGNTTTSGTTTTGGTP